MTVYLHGVGHFHPDNEIDNRFLSELDIGTDDAWIMERVGIRTRRTVLPLDYIRETRNADIRGAAEAALYSNGETGARAAEVAISRAGLHASDVGLVIAGGCAPDTSCPAEACNVAAVLGLDVPCFDISSGCTSLHAALFALSMMDPKRVPSFVLVVIPENMTRVVDYRDRSTAVLWGDASVAAVVSLEQPSGARIVGSRLMSDPSGHQVVRVPRAGHFDQQGPTVQRFAIKKTVATLKAFSDKYREPAREFHFVGHQANAHMLGNVCGRMGIDGAHHHCNVVEFGNTGAAGSLSVLSQRWDDWTAQDDVAVIGVGAGLTWSGYLVRFGEQR